jgi:nicotinamidase-related amidase
VPATSRALLEIDFQPWILDLAHDRGVVDRARALRSWARREGLLVVVTRYLSTDPGDPLRADRRGPGARFLDGLAPERDDLLFTKYGRDVFDNPDLDDTLRLRGVDRLVVDGLLTDAGVLLSVTTGLAHGYEVEVAPAACAGMSLEQHEEALATMRSAGATVLNS